MTTQHENSCYFDVADPIVSWYSEIICNLELKAWVFIAF